MALTVEKRGKVHRPYVLVAEFERALGVTLAWWPQGSSEGSREAYVRITRLLSAERQERAQRGRGAGVCLVLTGGGRVLPGVFPAQLPVSSTGQ